MLPNFQHNILLLFVTACSDHQEFFRAFCLFELIGVGLGPSGLDYITEMYYQTVDKQSSRPTERKTIFEADE